MHLHGVTIFLLLIILIIIALLVWRGVRRARPAPPLEMLPSEIFAAIQQAPVLEQPRAGKAYIGAQVGWHMTFESAITVSPISLRLMLVDEERFPWVWCNIHKRKYPQINGLVQHSPLWVSGQISKITPDEIFLKHAQLEFEG
ncbi:MAG: hypothetical protein ACRYFS_10100 [Janthinobacterium lividum]